MPELDRSIEAGRRDPFPVGTERHALDPARMAVQRADLLGRGIPDLHRRIGPPPGENATIVGMKYYAFHATGGVRQLVEQLPGFGVPDLDDTIPTTRRQEPPILAECYAAHPIAVDQGVHDFLASHHVPDSDGAIRTGRGQTRDIRIGTERHIKYRPAVAAESA